MKKRTRDRKGDTLGERGGVDRYGDKKHETQLAGEGTGESEKCNVYWNFSVH